MTEFHPSGDLFERRFEIAGSAVHLRLDPVEPWERDFICRYRIVWPDGEFTGHAGGVDALQAFLLALQGAHINLLGLRGTEFDGRVTWLGAADLGLPLPPDLRADDLRPSR